MEQQSPYKWLLIMAVALVLLAGFGYSAQKPQLLQHIPFLGPSPTPTPLASANIILYTPHADDAVSQEFSITGKARSMTNVVTVRLKDKLSGNSFGQTQTTTDAQQPGQFGNFQAEVQLSNPDLKDGEELMLEVFQVNPQTGKDMDTVSVPITFRPNANN